MKVLETAGRLLRLGFFIGLGTASALVQACGAKSARVDTAVDRGTQDLQLQDAGADATRSDAARPDAAQTDAGTDATQPKDSHWDLPLE